MPLHPLSSNDPKDMQCILGVDLSSQPCEITVSRIEGEQVEVLERTTAVIPLLLDKAFLSKGDIRSLLASRNDDKLPSENGDGSGAASREGAEQGEDSAREQVRSAVAALKEAIASLQTEWTASSVIIPPHDHVSLNLTLPFGDQRSLNAIVGNQIQDMLPFETDEFLIQYCTVGLFEAGTGITSADQDPSAPPFDIHVGVIPRGFVRNLLELCKASGLEPNVLTVPSSAVAAVYHLGKSFFKENSAIVFNRGEEYSMAVLVNGEVRVERALLASNIIPAKASDHREESLKHIFTALKLMIASTERRYGTRIENVYLLGRDVKGSNLQQLFGRPLEGLRFEDLLRSNESQIGLSALSAVFAKDENAPTPLVNYRTGEFSFTPRIGEFIRALLGARAYFLTAAIAGVVAVAGVYGIREFTIAQSRSALEEQIRTVIPNFESTDEDVFTSLASAQKKLSDELGVLGSPAKVSVLEALLEIFKLFPSDGATTVNSIKISDTKATITGTASSISSSESIAKALKMSKDVFSKVEQPRTSPSGSKFNFTIEATLAL